MTAEVLVAPDAAAIVVAYLDAALDVPVAYKVPKVRPAEFVSLAVTGGAGRRSLVLQDVTVSIDYWAEDAHAAMDGARLVEGHMLAARFILPEVYNVDSFGAPTDFPDPLSGKARARATYSLTLRATPIT